MKSSSTLNLLLQINFVRAVVIVILSLALCLGSDGCVANEAVEISRDYFCSDPFCFPSTLMSPITHEELKNTNGEFSKDTTVDELRKSENIRCSLVDSVNYKEASYSEDKNHTFELLKSLPPDVWFRSTIGEKLSLHDYKDQIEPIDTGSSSMPFMQISPPSLEWGVKNLYSPSLAFLKVSNLYNESVVDVYEPFSSDPQFYAHEFSQISLSPGEAASIPFTFLPRQLGSSSAHIVLQTSIGGFVVQATGTAVESPYGAKAWVANTHSCRFLSRKFSLHNPFDEVLYVDEVSAWTLFMHGNETKSSGVLCSKEVHRKFPGDPNRFVVNSDEIGLLSVGFRPYGHWKLPSNGAETILEIDLRLCTEGKIFGAVCLQLHSSRADEHDTVVVPYEIEIHSAKVYHDELVSASLEPLVCCNARESKFVLSVKNRSPYFLTVVNVHESTEELKLFKITFMKGLLLYPGSETHIAFVSFSVESDFEYNIQNRDSVEALDCKILLMANNSASPLIEIPCHDLIGTNSGKDFAITTSLNDDTCIGMSMQQEKPMNAKTSSLNSIAEEPLCIESKRLGLEDVDEYVLNNWKSQGTKSGSSVLQDNEIFFPVVQVGMCFSKWITVHNPYEKPVVVQLLLNSAVVVSNCRNCHLTEDTMKESFLYGEYHSKFMQIRYGFSIEESGFTETIVEPFGFAALGPVLFCPSAQCTWRSSAIVRNNLSGVEWLPLRAFGGSHSITLLEGSEPVDELEFKLNFPVNSNVSSSKSLNNLEGYNASCADILSKEIYAKNTGIVPFEVINLGVSGGGCKLGGFFIHTCEGFALSPGESKRLQISYQASGHSTLVFRRDLEMVMASGVHVVPMIVIFPNEMLKICRKASWTTAYFVKPFFLVMFVTVPIAYFAFSRFKHLFSSSSDGHAKFDNTFNKISNTRKSSRPHSSTRKARLHKDEDKLKKTFYPHSDQREEKLPSHPSSSSSVPNGTKNIDGEEVLVHHEKNLPPSPSSSSLVPNGTVGRTDNHITTENFNLTVRVSKEKGKRRKKKASLASKFEVSSSHSGTSTPSSPLSPNISTPRDSWPVSYDNQDAPSGQESFSKKQDSVARTDIKTLEASGSNSLPSYGNKTPRAAVSSSLKPSQPPSVELPFTNLIAPSIATPSTLTKMSPMALHARAPGANISKERNLKPEGGYASKEEFVYDIWGNNHLGDHLVGKQKANDASEGNNNYQSFFSRDLQKTLMMMSSACSVPPGCNTVPLCNADYYNEKK